MKRLSSILTVILSASAVFSLATACVEEVPEVVDELDLRACLTPSSTSASIDRADGKTVTFTWSNSRGASGYTVEVFEGAETADPETVFADNEPASTHEVPAVSDGKTTTSLKQTLDMDRFYFARVRAESDAKEPSQWAVFPYPIATYDVKPDVKSIEVRERTSASITIAFTLPEGDADADQLRISPNTFDDSGMEYYKYMFAEHNVSVTAGGTVEVEVEGLDPSVKYTLAVHYGSANRGEVSAWTKPSLEDATPVNTSEALVQALADGAREILVAYSETPYVISTIEGENVTDTQLGLNETKEINVYGDGTADGKMPTIIGRFTVPEGLASLHLEGLNFDGQDYALSHTIQIGEKVTTDITSISMLNCTVTGYKHGFFYYSNEVNSTAGIGKLSFSNIMVTDIAGNGGNGFDIRQACTIGDISITESTFSEGFRTFMRIDAATVGTLKFNNNTLNHLCHIENGNNKGLFYIGSGKGNVVIPTFEMNKNVFLNMNGNATRTVFFSDEKGVPAKMSNNFYYRLGEGFWAPEELNGEKINVNGKGKLTQSQGLAGGGAILSADPCVNSEDGILNINSSSAAGVMVLDAKAGDPRWFAEYVPEPLPELEPVAYGTSWTLNDQETYDTAIEDSTVIANTEFYIDENPIKVTDKGFEFTAEATLTATGTPSDCAMGFLVGGSGSLVLSTERSNSGTVNDHITVAVGPEDGSEASVKGAVFAGASRTRVVLPDLQGRSKIYIYACGPVILTSLQWIEDVTTVGPSMLQTPSNVVIDPADATDGTVTLSWDEVPNAASYKVKWTGPIPSMEDSLTVETNSYEIAAESLATGIYNFVVRADVEETDLTHINSELSEPVKFIKRETLVNLPTSKETVWGNDDFTFMQNLIGSNQNTDPETIWGDSFIYNNLEYFAGNTIRFADSDGLVCFQYPGSSNNPPNRRYLRFLASGNGTVTITFDATSKGRNLYVMVNGVSGPAHEAPNTSDDGVERGTFSESVTASAGDEIILWADASLRVFEIKWTPEGYDPDADLPAVAGLTPVKTETTWGTEEFLSLFEQRTDKTINYGTNFEIAEDYYVVNNLMFYGKGTMRVGTDGAYYQFSGGSFDEGDDPSTYYRRFMRFRANGNGTLTVYGRGSGSGQSDRNIYVAVGGAADQVPTGEVQTTVYDVGPNSDFTPVSWEITAEKGDAVTIFANNGLRISQIVWTPSL